MPVTHAELVDGQVQVLDGLCALVGVVVEQELAEVESNERDLGVVADLCRAFRRRST